jgi:hypothetical protein
MKIIITESQYTKFIKSSPAMRLAIEQYLNAYISKGERKIGKKSRNYGNLREDWCVNGFESIVAIYYFEGDKFNEGVLLVSKKLIKTIQSIFTVKESFIMNVFEEWYEETMVPKFEDIVGETGLYINNIYFYDTESECIPEPVKPDDITDEEMIDFIEKNTLYKKQEIIDKIQSGERDLEDFYLDIVHTVERKKARPF